MEPTKNRQTDCAGGQPKIDGTYQPLTVHFVGEGAGGQDEQKKRKRGHR